MNRAVVKQPHVNAILLDFFREAGRKGGKLGGRLGGKRRARKLTSARRKAIAKKAAQARWRKKK